jgi:hypothetical protein
MLFEPARLPSIKGVHLQVEHREEFRFLFSAMACELHVLK